MSRRRTGRRAVPGDSAADLGPDDGVDPKTFHDRRAGRNVGRRKAQQLCGQVRDALLAIFAGCADEVLQNLLVVSVEPAPHTGRLMVTVAVPQPADATDRTTAVRHLDRATGLVRREMAAAAHRRKVPELAFRVI